MINRGSYEDLSVLEVTRRMNNGDEFNAIVRGSIWLFLPVPFRLPPPATPSPPRDPHNVWLAFVVLPTVFVRTARVYHAFLVRPHFVTCSRDVVCVIC